MYNTDDSCSVVHDIAVINIAQSYVHMLANQDILQLRKYIHTYIGKVI